MQGLPLGRGAGVGAHARHRALRTQPYGSDSPVVGSARNRASTNFFPPYLPLTDSY